jgi:hypothetical protein
MVIRFLQTVPSENPDYPFMAGQVIAVACPSTFLLSLLDGKRAEVVRTDATERAIEPPIERAEPKAQRGRKRRAVR